jgi:anti-sigma regulatory factor (Ser/Thr protein kinase)
VTTRFESSIPATPEAVSELTEKVMAFLSENGVEPRPTHHVALVLDEILTNLGTHGKCRDQLVRITVSVEPDKVIGQVVDRGPPFDPRLTPDPPLDIALTDRPVGGLGLFLVRKLSASLEYTQRNGGNFTQFEISRS